MDLPKVFGSTLEAAAAADHLRETGYDKPLEVMPLSNGQAVLREYQNNGQNDQHD